ncbi:spliceosome-associated protein CWC27 homolog [Diachasmimorpha longicaudata]|uniref:spliceosome-associated protein CWC27 homolog n=1 Tax=Diachasmimorpha longicaudata TaxID=58733 RepID=UPI0030B9113B
MSNIYIQEPPTTGKVMMKTSVGDLDLELWTKEAPKACRNFIQLCMEGYYNDTIFHRLVKGFIVQGGDPTGTGEGGESIYGQPFKDEFHTRLRFCRRGLLAMANAGKDDNGSQFFFTFSATPELQNKHTIFGKVAGDTIYNMLKLEDALVDSNERPQYPQKVIRTEVLINPFNDIVPRHITTDKESKETKKAKKSGVKNFKLLSFGTEAEEDEEESDVLSKKLKGRGKSAHDNPGDSSLSSAPAVEPSGPPSKKKKVDRSSDWESDGEAQDEEEIERRRKETAEMKQRIFDKLKDKNSSQKKKAEPTYADASDHSDDEYYLGKDRHDERKKKAEEIRKEIKQFKREVHSEKKAKEEDDRKQKEQSLKKIERKKILNDYIPDQQKYEEARAKMPKKEKDRDKFALELLNRFKTKLNSKKMESQPTEGSPYDTPDDGDETDDSWMMHRLQCEEKNPVLAKDASTKADDWFEIYDPRNPLNKRRRGESSSARDNNRRDKLSKR